jgi:hypothetical protein
LCKIRPIVVFKTTTNRLKRRKRERKKERKGWNRRWRKVKVQLSVCVREWDVRDERESLWIPMGAIAVEVGSLSLSLSLSLSFYLSFYLACLPLCVLFVFFSFYRSNSYYLCFHLFVCRSFFYRLLFCVSHFLKISILSDFRQPNFSLFFMFS